MTGADVSLQANLSNGILEIENFNRPNEDFPDFASVMTEKISLSDFCKIAVIDEDEFDEDDYYDFYCNIDGSNLEDMEYDEFIDLCEYSELEEDDYSDFVKKMLELGYMNDDEFQEYSEDNEEEYTESYQYDPVKKEYIKDKESLVDVLPDGPIPEEIIKQIEHNTGKVAAELTVEEMYEALSKLGF